LQGTPLLLASERAALSAAAHPLGPKATPEDIVRAVLSGEGSQWQEDPTVRAVVLRLCARYLVQVRGSSCWVEPLWKLLRLLQI
jgi:hypothetical protein